MHKTFEFDETVAKTIARWARRLLTQMRLDTFNASDPISVVSFLSTFRLACNPHGIHEEAAMCLFHDLTKGPSGTSLNARIVFETDFVVEYGQSKGRNVEGLP